MTKKHILIVGGGFGGVKAALELSRHEQFIVTLLSDQTHFRYYPSLYHTATGGLHTQSNIPLKTLLGSSPVQMEHGKAMELDRTKKQITTEDGRDITYDTLILGLGMVTNYFGITGLAELSYGIKSLEDIYRLKRHLHEQLIDDHKPDHNYVVVGGGPTGIELAGALPEYIRTIMRNHGIRHRVVQVDLVEALPRLLPRSAKPVSRAVTRRLRKLGVRLYLNKAVKGETADNLMLDDRSLQSHTVIWTAGVTNNPFFQINSFPLNERKKVVVDEHLQVEPHIFVIGDNAATTYSGLAQTALYDASFVSKNLIHELNGEKMLTYKPKRPISVIPCGPKWAAIESGPWHYSGWLGWILRLAADWVAYSDYEPWWKASEQWLTEFGTEESCPTCIAALNNARAN